MIIKDPAELRIKDPAEINDKQDKPMISKTRQPLNRYYKGNYTEGQN